MINKAVVLLSGGLDSILAAKLMMELGIDIECVHYHIEFAACSGGADSATNAAKALGAPLKVFDITSEFLEVFKNPKHGYGANINPCIDCKIFMLKKAKEYMEASGASFLVTGEVLGERPMSQRRDALNIIERDAGVRGILLRPLSAKLLKPTLPEEEGVVDREKLLDISGRGRKPQFALAAKFNIKEYPNPSGGCLLTDPGFTRRVKDLFAHNALNLENLRLLKAGRHFRLSKETKLVVGRDQNDNELIGSMAGKDDLILKVKDIQGPISIIRGPIDEKLTILAASIAAQHTKLRDDKSVCIDLWRTGESNRATLTIKPATREEVDALRV